MFDDILIATDPEDSASAAPAIGYELASEVGGTVHLLAVVDDPPQRDQLRTDREAEIREMMEGSDQPVTSREIDTQVHVVSGVPAEEILAAINDLDVDLVVMGTRARSGLDKLVVGSVAESVIEKSPIPVLTIPPESSGSESTESAI